MQPPSTVVRNFGGHHICQTTVTHSQRGQKYKVTILVQKGAPLELLLGTDTLRKLGLQLLETEANGEVINLLPVYQGRAMRALQKFLAWYPHLRIRICRHNVVAIINST